MRYSKVNKFVYLIRLEKGEEVIDSITKFCEKLNISNASFIGLGSVENPVLAHYNVNIKKYSEKELKGIFELTNITGNVAVFEKKPLVHSHVTLSNEKMQAWGGHLVKGAVSATVEVILQVLDAACEKKQDDAIGLKLWDLPQEF